jgi:hypothetical protein
MTILWSKSHDKILVQFKSLARGDSESPIPTVSKKEPTTVVIGNFGLRLRLVSGMTSTALQTI